DLVGWLIGALLADKSFLDGAPRTPVLSALQARTAIDGRVWHSRIPLHVRVAIDDARFAHQRERPNEPYGVERDLQIATPALIAASIPLKDLGGVLDVAGQALGFEDGAAPQARPNAREKHSARPPGPVESTEDVPKAPPSVVKGAGPVESLADLLESSMPEPSTKPGKIAGLASEESNTAKFEFESPDTVEPSADHFEPLYDEMEPTNPGSVVALKGGSESVKPPKE
ncbi:MAG: hypothetical protein HOV80_37955, partial [Polyangiaceae bacterium]|nr:hypothetical protein [Polyangiaceae bacterium]